MNSPDAELQRLIQASLDGRASETEAEQLNARLRDDAASRDLYLELADLHACLATDAELWAGVGSRLSMVEKTAPRPPHERPNDFLIRPLFYAAAAACLVAVGIGLGALKSSLLPRLGNSRQQIATFGELTDCRWVSPTAAIHQGDAICSGQRVELSSGAVNLHFASGAKVRLVGPAILEPKSANSALLVLGEVAAAAETPQSRGFTLQTRTAQLVDIGTRFTAAAAADGRCRVEVSSGAADVRFEGTEAVQHLTAGDALCVEPGERQIMTRIESGDETPAFRFPTIEPPSNQDYADRSRGHATVRVVRGQLKGGVGASGPVSVLLDGHGQSVDDSSDESAFFRDDPDGGGSAFLVDLGQAVAIAKINSYSWHQNTTYEEHRHRAVQKYTLYAFAGDALPPTDGNLEEAGWERLARVNTDDYFHVDEPLRRPAQQACSITSARGTIGRYRYLLWEVEPTVGSYIKGAHDKRYGTFYGEFDVYVSDSPQAD